MRVLHHHPLYGASRTVRLLLAERNLVYLPKMETPWDRHEDFLTINPSGEVPVLVTEDGDVLSGTMVIAEYLEETEDAETSLIWGTAASVPKPSPDRLVRAQIRDRGGNAAPQ